MPEIPTVTLHHSKHGKRVVNQTEYEASQKSFADAGWKTAKATASVPSKSKVEDAPPKLKVEEKPAAPGSVNITVGKVPDKKG